MNILFLTLSRITDISQRGIYSDLMRAFVKAGHKVYMVVPYERKFGRKTELTESCGANILGVKTLNIQKTNVIEKGIGTLLLEWQYLNAIKHYLSGISFDLVLYSTPPITFNTVIASVKRKYGAESYLLLKDIFPQNAVDLKMFPKWSPIYWFFRAKERKLYKLSDRIGCMSPANVRYVVKHNPKIDPSKVELCPNSIELLEENRIDNKSSKESALLSKDVQNLSEPQCHSKEIRKQYSIPEDKILCVYGGNLGKPQGVDFLIETIAGNEKRDNCFFLVVGSGTEFGKLRQWFYTHSPKNALLLQALPKADYDKLMKAAQIGLIFLDRRFTIPNYPSRLLSYLENRIPVMMATDVNTDIGPIAEENGYGLWAQSGDIESFDTKLDSILASASLRSEMGDRGYKFLKENYSIEKAAEIILSGAD